jgi:hypothetical protein
MAVAGKSDRPEGSFIAFDETSALSEASVVRQVLRQKVKPSPYMTFPGIVRPYALQPISTAQKPQDFCTIPTISRAMLTKDALS